MPWQDLKGINNVKLGGLTEDLLLKSMRMHDAREWSSGTRQACSRQAAVARHALSWEVRRPGWEAAHCSSGLQR